MARGASAVRKRYHWLWPAWVRNKIAQKPEMLAPSSNHITGSRRVERVARAPAMPMLPQPTESR